jgi:hypothetical protein
MYRVKDPVFAMAESSFLDGGSRLGDVDVQALTSVSEWRSVAHLLAKFPNVGRCRVRHCSWEVGEKRGETVSREVIDLGCRLDRPCRPKESGPAIHTSSRKCYRWPDRG